MKKLLLIFCFVLLTLTIVVPVAAQQAPNQTSTIVAPTPVVNQADKTRLLNNITVMRKNLNAYSRKFKLLSYVSATAKVQFSSNTKDTRKTLKDLATTITATTNGDTYKTIKNGAYKDAKNRYFELRQSYNYIQALKTPYSRLAYYQTWETGLQSKITKAKTLNLEITQLQQKLNKVQADITSIQTAADAFVNKVVFAAPKQVGTTIKSVSQDRLTFYRNVYGYNQVQNELGALNFINNIPLIDSLSKPSATIWEKLTIQGSGFNRFSYVYFSINNKTFNLDQNNILWVKNDGTQIGIQVPDRVYTYQNDDCNIKTWLTSCGNKLKTVELDSGQTISVRVESNGTQSNVVSLVIAAKPNNCVAHNGTCVTGNTCPSGTTHYQANACSKGTYCCVPNTTTTTGNTNP